ncbi:MAG: serine/threonine-protein kinase [Myxococcota bacterium]
MAPVEPESADDVTAEVEADALDPLVGVTLDGRFRIVDIIGKGAMGKVYRAVQVPLNRAVALKVLDSRYGAGREDSFKQRFLVEAALTAKLSHPNTVRVLDYGSTKDGLFYLAMEYLDGESLDRLLLRGPLPWRRVLNIGQQVARALKEAHELGVVHRDLKPGNVLLLDAGDGTDHVKVLDFGLVKSFVEGHELEGRAITQQGMLMGSPPYMAPEQGEKNRADPRSDIYSLGVVLYEALTGQPPFRGGAPLEIILKHVHEPVPPVATPRGFEPIPEAFTAAVHKCLAKSPMDRFQTMDEVLSALQDVVPVTLTPAQETPSVEVALPPRKSPLVLVLGFVLAMMVGVGATLLVLKRQQPPPPQPAPPAPLVVEPARPTPSDDLVVVAPSTPTKVTFHIESVPPGATVTLGGQVLGVTPLDVERPAGAGGRTMLEVTLTKDGYLPMTATAGGSGGRVELLQKLQPVPVEAPTPKEAPQGKEGLPAPKAPQDPPPAPKASPPPPKEPPRTKALKPPQVKPVEPPRPEKKSRPVPAPKPASRLDEDDEGAPADELKRPGPAP